MEDGPAASGEMATLSQPVACEGNGAEGSAEGHAQAEPSAPPTGQARRGRGRGKPASADGDGSTSSGSSPTRDKCNTTTTPPADGQAQPAQAQAEGKDGRAQVEGEPAGRAQAEGEPVGPIGPNAADLPDGQAEGEPTGRAQANGQAQAPTGQAQAKPASGSEGTDAGSSEQEKQSVACQLVHMAEIGDVLLVRTADEVAYAVVPQNDHEEVWPVRSRGLRRWLRLQYHKETGRLPGSTPLQEAIDTLEDKAMIGGPARQVFTRVGECDGKLYLDLADDQWRVVEIDAEGWRVLSRPPVLFWRPRGARPLPVPESGCNLQPLREMVNVASEADWLMLLGYLFACLRPTGPYPVLLPTGEQGTGKSTLARIIRRLVDPSTVDLRAAPKDVRDLGIAAKNSWLLPFDNISHLPEWLSDGLCRMSTGGSTTTRQLYSDDEETTLPMCRPVVITSIVDVASANDLLERAVYLHLTPIADTARRTETDLWREFDEYRPRVLGALLSAVSAGLALLPGIRLPSQPRMADFAVWAEACVRGAKCSPGAFLDAYAGNRQAVNAQALEGSAVAQAILERFGEGGTRGFRGTAQELLTLLNEHDPEASEKVKQWPKSPRALSSQLRRTAPNLRQAGLTVELGEREGKTRQRIIVLQPPLADQSADANAGGGR
jgi:hypothetical protein